jgi:hypothetical protein
MPADAGARFSRRSGFPQDDDKAGNVEIGAAVLVEERAA